MREAEITAVLGQVGPLVAEATANLDGFLLVGDEVARRPVTEALLNSLIKLTDAEDLIATTRKSVALYLATQHRVPQRELAKYLGVTSTTVFRWLKEMREAEGGAAAD